eukprot:5102617-Alexandrium_andersonii.AAC.1
MCIRDSRLTAWKDLLSLADRRNFCKRPMATATPTLPRDEVAVAESARREVQEGFHCARRTIAMN